LDESGTAGLETAKAWLGTTESGKSLSRPVSEKAIATAISLSPPFAGVSRAPTGAVVQATGQRHQRRSQPGQIEFFAHPRHDHQIPTVRKVPARQPKRLATQTLDPIASHRIAVPNRHRQPDPRGSGGLPATPQHEHSAVTDAPRDAEHLGNFRAGSNSTSRWKTLVAQKFTFPLQGLYKYRIISANRFGFLFVSPKDR
jgi:hypothetical protein